MSRRSRRSRRCPSRRKRRNTTTIRPTFEDAGGGIVADPQGPKLGGLGGLSIKDLPGPGGPGGVGVGVGTGTHAGFGRTGRRLWPPRQGPPRGAAWRRRRHQGFRTRRRRRTELALPPPDARRAVGRWTSAISARAGRAPAPAWSSPTLRRPPWPCLPFLAYGLTHKSKVSTNRRSPRALPGSSNSSARDGDLAGNAPQPMYSHGLATIALCEAYGMTHDEHVGLAARQAVAFIERAQNQSTGGWRYTPGDSGDTSVFGWQIMALKSAVLAGLPVNSQVFDNGQKWLHAVAKGEHLGLYSYQPYRRSHSHHDRRGNALPAVPGHRSQRPGHAGRQTLPAGKPSRRQVDAERLLLVLRHAGHAQLRRRRLGRLEPHRCGAC